MHSVHKREAIVDFVDSCIPVVLEMQDAQPPYNDEEERVFVSLSSHPIIWFFETQATLGCVLEIRLICLKNLRNQNKGGGREEHLPQELGIDLIFPGKSYRDRHHLPERLHLPKRVGRDPKICVNILVGVERFVQG